MFFSPGAFGTLFFHGGFLKPNEELQRLHGNTPLNPKELFGNKAIT